MVAGKKLVAVAAALTILVIPLVGATAQTRTYHRHYGYRPLYRPVPTGYWNYPGYGYGYGNGFGTAITTDTIMGGDFGPLRVDGTTHVSTRRGFRLSSHAPQSNASLQGQPLSEAGLNRV